MSKKQFSQFSPPKLHLECFI